MSRFAAFVLIFIVVGCGARNDVPKEVLPPKSMEKMLWDMIMADGIVSYDLQFDTTLDQNSKRMVLYQSILRTHKVSKEKFKRSLEFYQNRPDLLKIVLDSMQQQSMRELNEITKDSL